MICLPSTIPFYWLIRSKDPSLGLLWSLYNWVGYLMSSPLLHLTTRVLVTTQLARHFMSCYQLVTLRRYVKSSLQKAGNIETPPEVQPFAPPEKWVGWKMILSFLGYQTFRCELLNFQGAQNHQFFGGLQVRFRWVWWQHRPAPSITAIFKDAYKQTIGQVRQVQGWMWLDVSSPEIQYIQYHYSEVCFPWKNWPKYK